jgi:hypothetical protein
LLFEEVVDDPEDHAYVYGEVPPDTIALADPVAPPKQFGFVVVTLTMLKPLQVVDAQLKDSTTVQLLTSVTVTLKLPLPILEIEDVEDIWVLFPSAHL